MSFEHEDNSSSEAGCELLNHNIHHHDDDTDEDEDDDEEADNSDMENDMSIMYEQESGDEEDDNNDHKGNDEHEKKQNGNCRNGSLAAAGEDDISSDDTDDDCHNIFDVKPTNLEVNHNSTLNDVPRIRWSPGSWQDGTRRSAFQPYRPTLVLTNLQRGNIPTESSAPEQTDVSFHHRAGQGEISLQEIEQEENIDAKDSNGLSALMWASAYGQVPTVQLLIDKGAKVNLEGKEGETPLLLAAAGGHHEVVRLLLTEGANVNHADEIGNTAIMYAAHGDHPHCTNELLLRGADVTMVNLNDDSAFGIAVKRGSKLAQAVIENYLLTLLS